MLAQIRNELSGLSIIQTLRVKLVRQSSVRFFGTDDENLMFRERQHLKQISDESEGPVAYETMSQDDAHC